MMKNVFYFMSKADFLVMQKNRQRQQIIKIYILPIISRSKGNEAVKFGQLIKYNVKNIFLQSFL